MRLVPIPDDKQFQGKAPSTSPPLSVCAPCSFCIKSFYPDSCVWWPYCPPSFTGGGYQGHIAWKGSWDLTPLFCFANVKATRIAFSSEKGQELRAMLCQPHRRQSAACLEGIWAFAGVAGVWLGGSAVGKILEVHTASENESVVSFYRI